MNLATTLSLQANRKLHDRLIFQGLQISVENAKGSTRSGVDPKGKKWSTKMLVPYGYVRMSMGVDGDHVDCFVGPDENSDKVFVITIRKPPDFKEDDEQKAMLGFASGKAAKDMLLSHYDTPKFFGHMDTMSFADFKKKVLATKDNPGMIHSEGEFVGGSVSIDPINLKLHPPSLANPDYIPTPDPLETDDKYLDVTRRNAFVGDLEKSGGANGTGPDGGYTSVGTVLVIPPASPY